MPKREISARAKRVWLRLIDWYGARVVEQYGESPPEDWCAAVDATDNTGIKRALTLIRANYPAHPPTLPQFEQVLKPSRAAAAAGPSVQERLCAFVVKTHGPNLTDRQLRGPWTYLYRDGECTGVVIEPDQLRPGYRVMVLDMQTEAATA